MSRPELLLGLDLGTTRVKAVAVDLDGRMVAAAVQPTPWHADGVGVAMDARELRGLVLDVCARAAGDAADLTGGRVAGIGVTGMGEAGVLADTDDAPLAAVRAWHDGRADVNRVRREVGEVAFHEAVGMPLDAQPSLCKLALVRREHPAAMARAARFYSVPEWAARCLGARPVSELSLASRTGLLDVVTGRPWDAATALLGVSLLAELVVAGTDVGRAGGEGVAPALQGATLTVAGHDHQAAAVAAGAVVDGTLLDSLGTAEALLRFTGRLDRDVVGSLAGQGFTAGRTVVADHWCVLLGLRTGFALERVAAALGARDRAARLALGEAAATAGAGGVLARVDRDAVHLTLRLDGDHHDLNPGAVWAATVEAAVEASRPGADRIAEIVGGHRAVVATGGWVANPAVLEAKRRQFPGLVVSRVSEAGAAGAAYLAGAAAGLLPAPGPASPVLWTGAEVPAEPQRHG